MVSYIAPGPLMCAVPASVTEYIIPATAVIAAPSAVVERCGVRGVDAKRGVPCVSSSGVRSASAREETDIPAHAVIPVPAPAVSLCAPVPDVIEATVRVVEDTAPAPIATRSPAVSGFVPFLRCTQRGRQ